MFFSCHFRICIDFTLLLNGMSTVSFTLYVVLPHRLPMNLAGTGEIRGGTLSIMQLFHVCTKSEIQFIVLNIVPKHVFFFFFLLFILWLVHVSNNKFFMQPFYNSILHSCTCMCFLNHDIVTVIVSH